MSSTIAASPIADRASGLSARYARALYDLADERKQLDQTVSEMAALGSLIGDSAPLRQLIASRSIDAAEAARAMEAVLAGQGFSDLVRHFIGTAVANRRLRDLPELISGFAAYVAAKRGIMTAEVASAHPLTDTQRAQLGARLAEAGYGRVTIRESVDPSLLGGLVVKIGSKLYDTSLKSRLQRLRFVMKGAA
ncbi:F0F1 ATP synthase subunit delta [Acidiphilium sp. PA]|uniref:F0F1 ATP synthase subunit delta n=1 Tax=Acidiphilium sp. PA TaxID=2871705 RepID=UPI002244DB04|nr:F0F1 ATP synthase subunit delta [Acidiphilium sp. PA]MCW8305810.1 F0F1 ATP synthase subunit delta [Acidiphilium sp. PA]